MSALLYLHFYYTREIRVKVPLITKFIYFYKTTSFFLWSPEGNSRREVRREPLINLILYNPPLSPFSLSLFLSLSIIPIPIYSLSLRSAEQTLYVCTFWGYFQIKSAVSKAGRRSPFQFTKWVLGTSDY